jgi:hypothetical protein
MSKTTLLCGFASALLMIGSAAMAQTAAAPAPKSTAANKANIDQEIKLLRQDVRSEKSRTMLAALQLNAEQTAKFTPIYQSFQADLAKLSDMREANIREYAKNYDTMTDTKADELVNQAITYYKKRTDLIASYYDKIRASLGTGVAARFVQVEAMLNNIIDLQIQSNLPLITTPTSG